MKKGSKEHPLCPLWAGRVDPKISRANATACRTAGGCGAFLLWTSKSCSSLGKGRLCYEKQSQGLTFSKRYLVLALRLLRCMVMNNTWSRCQRHQCSVEIVHFFHFMSSLDYIKEEEGKNLKAENMLKQVTVVTELTTARKFQFRVLTPSSLNTQSKSSTSKPLG